MHYPVVTERVTECPLVTATGTGVAIGTDRK